MFENKNRIKTYLETIIHETELIPEMSKTIEKPNDFLTDITGMTIFRACGMSLQYVTETCIKIRNLVGKEFFDQYDDVPWVEIFGLRNFISHAYGDVEEKDIFNTIKKDIPTLNSTAKQMLEDLNAGKLDRFFFIS
jgi:uncharacterized protein with HEPN domain